MWVHGCYRKRSGQHHTNRVGLSLARVASKFADYAVSVLEGPAGHCCARQNRLLHQTIGLEFIKRKNKGQNVNVTTVSPCNSNAIRQKCSIVTKNKNKTERGQARLRVPAAQNSSRRRSQRHDPIDRLGMCCAGIRVARVFNTQTPAHAHTHTHTQNVNTSTPHRYKSVQ